MPPKPRLECEERIKKHNHFIFEAISRWYFNFPIDKNGDQVVDKTLTPSPWTTPMDYPNGLPKWTTLKWTTPKNTISDYAPINVKPEGGGGGGRATHGNLTVTLIPRVGILT